MVYAMPHQFLMTLQTEILSTVTSDFLKEKIILKSFNSLVAAVFYFLALQTIFCGALFGCCTDVTSSVQAWEGLEIF